MAVGVEGGVAGGIEQRHVHGTGGRTGAQAVGGKEIEEGQKPGGVGGGVGVGG